MVYSTDKIIYVDEAYVNHIDENGKHIFGYDSAEKKGEMLKNKGFDFVLTKDCGDYRGLFAVRVK